MGYRRDNPTRAKDVCDVKNVTESPVMAAFSLFTGETNEFSVERIAFHASGAEVPGDGNENVVARNEFTDVCNENL